MARAAQSGMGMAEDDVEWTGNEKNYHEVTTSNMLRCKYIAEIWSQNNRC